MITATELQLQQLQKALPVNTPHLPATVMREFKSNSPALRGYFISLEMTRTLFACYREVLKIPYSEVAVANATRAWLPEWVMLHNWLQAQVCSPALFLRAQVETLHRKIQPRGMRSQKALDRYYRWVESVRLKTDTPGQALKKLDRLEKLRWRNPLETMLAEVAAGREYVDGCSLRFKLSRPAVICLESWHLPAPFFLADHEALDLLESGAFDQDLVRRVKAVAKELRQRGELNQFLAAVGCE